MTESHLESLYQEAKSALKARDYEYAIELLKRVLVIDETYKDTSRLLEKAVRLRKLRWYKNPRLWGALGLVVVFFLGFVIAPRIGGLFTRPAPTNTTSLTITNTALPISTPTVTPTWTPFPTSTATPPPAWVTNFAEPILTAIKDREPDFQDDFSSVNLKGWNAPGKNVPGWGCSISIEEGVMRLGQDCSASFSYPENRANYVLLVDIFPPASGYVHVYIQGDNAIYLERSNYGFCRGIWDDCVGMGPHKISQKAQLTVIVKDSQVGFYLMGNPEYYFEDPALAVAESAQPHFICTNFCEFDNVKFWNLDKVPNLP
jgi:hypothetical protein